MPLHAPLVQGYLLEGSNTTVVVAATDSLGARSLHIRLVTGVRVAGPTLAASAQAISQVNGMRTEGVHLIWLPLLV
jgi:hypothetical protein